MQETVPGSGNCMNCKKIPATPTVKVDSRGGRTGPLATCMCMQYINNTKPYKVQYISKLYVYSSVHADIHKVKINI